MSAIYKSAEGERAVHDRYREFLARWPVAHQELRLATREGETFVVGCGLETAPPLLLFHGSGANTAMWLGDVASWSQAFRVYAVDMIGESGFSAQARPTPGSDDYALWLDDVLAGLSLARVSLCGVSLGGWLAVDYETRRPERVARLALLCPGGVGRTKNFLMWGLPLLLLGAWGRRKVLEVVLGIRRSDSTAGEKELGEFTALIFKHFRPRTEKLPVFSDAQLARLTMPVLAIVGGRDVLLDSSDTKRRLEAHVPTAEVVFLPEDGHLIRHQTAAVLNFLRGDMQHQTAA